MPERTERLLAEVPVLDDIGPTRRSSTHGRAGTALMWLLPVLILLGLVLAWPAVKTFQWSVSTATGSFAGAGNFRAVLTDPQFWTALRNTGIWAVAVPVLVTALGYVLAVLSRRIRASFVFTLVLLPMALPLVVTGIAFRLLYSPSPTLGPATAIMHSLAGIFGAEPEDVAPLLGPRLVTAALISAFIWAWIGLAVVVLRTALDNIPSGLDDAVRAEGAGSWRVLRDVQWPFLRRSAAILVVLLAVVASRTFDLVLVMAPGSVQDEAEVLALYILRQANVQAFGEGAAVGVVWLLVAAVGAMLAVRWARHEWPAPAGAGQPGPLGRGSAWRPGRTATTGRLAGRVALWFVAAVWIFPIVLLVLVSLHEPVDPVIRGWLAPLSLDSYRELFSTEFPHALAPTATVAVFVTIAVVVLAALAAHSLAWLNPYGAGAATVVLLAAAIVPIQAIAKPLHGLLSPLGLQGTVLALVVVHIGRGLPFAVLVLRNAFAAVPADRLRLARLQMGGEAEVFLRVVVPAAWPAIVAVAALDFVLVWNDLAVGFLFGGPGFTPVGLTLLGQSRQFATTAGLLAAGSVIATLPPLLVVLLARRHLAAGLVTGVASR